MTLRASAAILLWRPIGGKRGGTCCPLEVYLAQRSTRVLFMPGYWAFAGGRVEPRDLPPDAAAAAGEAALHTLTAEGGTGGVSCCVGRAGGTPAAAEKAEKEGLLEECAAQACARRELFEELGVWSYGPPPFTQAHRASARRRLLAGAAAATIGAPAQHGAAGAQAPLLPLADFVTPHFTGPRYLARYYALALPRGETVQIWPGELQAGGWYTPQAALAAHAQALLLLAPPVLATLQALADAEGPAEARLAAAAARLRQEQAGTRWTRKLAPGIEVAPVRSPTLPPSTHTNCYVLGERSLVVVDPGTPYAGEQEALCAYLDRRLEQGAQVQQVWLTHHHPDHTGAAGLLQARYGARVAAHAATAERLVDKLACDTTIADEACLWVDGVAWQALHTPGHAPGHLCFHDTGRGHLLSGDNVLGVGGSIVVPQPEGCARAYVKSLRRLLDLSLGLLLPGHGPPAALAHGRIEEALRQRFVREEMLLRLVESSEGPLTVQALVAKLYRGLAADARGLAALSCLAHVEKLVDDGAVVLVGGTGLASIVARRPRADTCV